MVDSYGKMHWPKIGHQVKEDWDLWKKLVTEDAGNFPIVDLAGNHDMWAIIDPLSNQNMFLDYSYTFNRENTKTIHDLHVKKIVKEGITFILMNQYRFPDIHPPYTYWAHPSSEFLDDLEEAIDNAGPCYVCMHYPVDYNWWVRSSKGHTFEQIMEKPNVEVIFSGHFHPYNPQIIHHKQGGVEYIGIGAYQMKGFGIVTVDNGRFVYTPIRLAEPPKKFIMTHPIPLDQLSSHQVFNELNTEIRVISYSSENVSLTVSGDVNGEMQRVADLPNGAALYTYPLSHMTGVHTITVTGPDCSINRTFFIGDSIRGTAEQAACAQRGLNMMRLSSVPVFLFMFFILLPCCKFDFLRNTERWIEGEGSSTTYYFRSLFFGPFLLHRRIHELSRVVRYSLFAAVLYSILGPNHFFKEIHGHIGWSFACFVYIAGYILFDEWAIHMSYFYLLCVVTTVMWYASSIKFIGKTWMFYVNWGFSLLMWAGVQIVNYRWCGESVIVPNLFVSPTFIIIPLVLQIVVYFFATKPALLKVKASLATAQYVSKRFEEETGQATEMEDAE